jgi:pSer/pThr/pTyr-binding forkhead associated (FHA) protein
MAILLVLDDGSRKQGEMIRVRKDRTVIGRESGDVLVAHDSSMSSQHAAIVREFDQGHYRWSLEDCGSRNGTFVRLARVVLKAGQELLIGSRRFRYQPAETRTSSAEQAGNASDTAAPKATMQWQAVSSADVEKMYPSLVEQKSSGEHGQKLTFTTDEMKLGANSEMCSLVIGDDPFVSPEHALIRKSHKGQWVIEDVGSTNGLWLLVRTLPLAGKCEFQLGEQRFIFQPV